MRSSVLFLRYVGTKTACNWEQCSKDLTENHCTLNFHEFSNAYEWSIHLGFMLYIKWPFLLHYMLLNMQKWNKKRHSPGMMPSETKDPLWALAGMSFTLALAKDMRQLSRSPRKIERSFAEHTSCLVNIWGCRRLSQPVKSCSRKQPVKCSWTKLPEGTLGKTSWEIVLPRNSRIEACNIHGLNNLSPWMNVTVGQNFFQVGSPLSLSMQQRVLEV